MTKWRPIGQTHGTHLSKSKVVLTNISTLKDKQPERSILVDKTPNREFRARKYRRPKLCTKTEEHEKLPKKEDTHKNAFLRQGVDKDGTLKEERRMKDNYDDKSRLCVQIRNERDSDRGDIFKKKRCRRQMRGYKLMRRKTELWAWPQEQDEEADDGRERERESISIIITSGIRWQRKRAENEAH